MMKIMLNGEGRELPPGMRLGGLLEMLGLGGRPVVVELNGRALLPREVPEAGVGEGDVIEIIQITAGG